MPPTRDAILQFLEAEAKRQGIDPNLVKSVAKHESGFSQAAVSPKGAVGVMQLMPGTADLLGVNPHDWQENIRGGVTYLGQQLSKYGRPDLAVAAYNAGPHRVDEYGGVPPFPETQKFVRNVLGTNVPAAQGGGQMARPEDKTSASLLSTADITVGQVPGIGELLSRVLAGGKAPEMQPLPAEGQPKPGPPASERFGAVMQGLGMLAGLGTESQRRTGEMITTLGVKESERARADQAARALGYQTSEQMAAAKTGAEIEATKAVGALSRARVPEATAKAIKETFGVITDAPVQLTTPDGLSMTVPQSKLAELQLKWKDLNLTTARFEQQKLVDAAVIDLHGAQAAHYRTNTRAVEEAIKKGQGTIPVLDPRTGAFVKDNEGNTVLFTSQEAIQAILRGSTEMSGGLRGSLMIVDEALKAINTMQAMGLTGKMAEGQQEALGRLKTQVAVQAEGYLASEDPLIRQLGMAIFRSLGLKIPAIAPGSRALPGSVETERPPAGLVKGAPPRAPGISGEAVQQLLRALPK